MSESLRYRINSKLQTTAQVVDFLGAFVLTVGATMLALVPRVDISLGGVFIAICGLILMDFNTQGKLGLVNFIQKYITDPSKFMGYCGLASCAFLGGGEFYYIVAEGQIYDFYHPGYIKVFANTFPYVFASLLCFSTFKRLLGNFNIYMIVFFQVSLFATGHLLITLYGMLAGNSAYDIGIVLFSGAFISLLAIILANIIPQQK